MINFLAYGKEVRLSDGRVITIKRKAIGHYYLLIASVIIYRNALEQTSGVKDLKDIHEYIKYMRDNALEFAKVKVEWGNIVKQLCDWIEGADCLKLEREDILHILNEVIKFNNMESDREGKPIKTIDQLNDQLESIVGALSILLKVTPGEIINHLDNYNASVLMAEHNRMRVQMMNDTRHAHNANREEYSKYTGRILGEKIVTGEDIFKNPNLLNEVH